MHSQVVRPESAFPALSHRDLRKLLSSAMLDASFAGMLSLVTRIRAA